MQNQIEYITKHIKVALHNQNDSDFAYYHKQINEKNKGDPTCEWPGHIIKPLS